MDSFFGFDRGVVAACVIRTLLANLREGRDQNNFEITRDSVVGEFGAVESAFKYLSKHLGNFTRDEFDVVLNAEAEKASIYLFQPGEELQFPTEREFIDALVPEDAKDDPDEVPFQII